MGNRLYTMNDLNPRHWFMPKEHRENLTEFCNVVCLFIKAYGTRLDVKSGYRSIDEQRFVYKCINERRILKNKSILPVPLGSAHLIGKAVDFDDPKNSLYDWCQRNVDVLDKLGLYIETVDWTPTWCHVQGIAPSSGARFFKPFGGNNE